MGDGEYCRNEKSGKMLDLAVVFAIVGREQELGWFVIGCQVKRSESV